MDSNRLQTTFFSFGERIRDASPLFGALCKGLAQGPSLALVDLYDRFFRITSVLNPDPVRLLGGLHYLALRGDAPELARSLPSCGGEFSSAVVLLETVEAVIHAQRDELLDFMLSHDPQPHLVERSAAVLLGALVTVDLFGGGLSLVDLGCAGGLHLRFDQYAYRFGMRSVGKSSTVIPVELTGKVESVERLLRHDLPPVTGRAGIDLVPHQTGDQEERLLLEAWHWPDQGDQLKRFRQAALLSAPELDLRQGEAASDLAALLVETYNTMAPGNTLMLYDCLVWSALSEVERKQIALTVQRLASQLQPHKPLAWLQVEPFSPGATTLELRLHTFGWSDPEDRTVRRLAEADPDLRWIRWSE